MNGNILPFAIQLYVSITVTTLATADAMLLLVFTQSHDEELLQEASSGADMDGRKTIMNGEQEFTVIFVCSCDGALPFTDTIAFRFPLCLSGAPAHTSVPQIQLQRAIEGGESRT